MNKVTRSYKVELLALVMVIMGICLLLDWSPILAVVDRVIVDVAQRVTPAMLIGAVLVMGASVFIVWRARVRFLSSPYWRTTVCPRCGSPIHRVHRTVLDKAASKAFLSHARRYRCEKTECGWTGLRHSRRHGTAINDK